MHLLSECLYLPPVSWFSATAEADMVWLEGKENYQKGSYRNRCHLSGSHGILRLSIPLAKGKHQQMPIREVLVDNTQNWATQHWRSIQSAYGKSPFFEFYSDELKDLYLAPPPTLFEWNYRLLLWLKEQIQWKPELEVTKEYIKRPNDVKDLRNTIRPQKTQNDLKPYAQVFQDRFGFLPDLSVLDLLFCTGPEASRYF